MALNGQFQFRRDTSGNWTANNPTLLSGEMGLETDTKKQKIGDGVTAWNSLAYTANVTGSQGATGIQGALGTQGSTGAGAQGATGSQGAKGSQGSGGSQGATGAGAQGATGGQGPSASQGASGAQGGTGTGTQGAQGVQGNQGTPASPGSTAAGEITITGNVTATTLTTQNTWYPVTAGWSVGDVLNGFTANTGAGSLTFTGTSVLNETLLNCSATLGNSSETYQIAVFKDGVLITEHEAELRGSTTEEPNVALMGADSMTTGNTFTIQARCTTRSNTSLTVTRANFSVIALSGSQGTPGAQGATGGQGPSASQGASGAQGPSGTSQGATGSQGGTGAQGPSASQGATGAQGPGASQGASGSQGGSGSQGPSGTSQGATGTQGGTGAQGPTGSGASPTDLIATNQGANYNSGSAYTLLAVSSTGLYRVTVYTVITTVDGVSSTLPSNTIGWTDPTSNVAQAWTATLTSTANTTTTWLENTAEFHAKTGTNITLTQAGYASNTASQMKFTICVSVEKL